MLPWVLPPTQYCGTLRCRLALGPPVRTQLKYRPFFISEEERDSDFLFLLGKQGKKHIRTKVSVLLGGPTVSHEVAEGRVVVVQRTTKVARGLCRPGRGRRGSWGLSAAPWELRDGPTTPAAVDSLHLLYRGQHISCV